MFQSSLYITNEANNRDKSAYHGTNRTIIPYCRGDNLSPIEVPIDGLACQYCSMVGAVAYRSRSVERVTKHYVASSFFEKLEISAL